MEKFKQKAMKTKRKEKKDFTFLIIFDVFFQIGNWYFSEKLLINCLMMKLLDQVEPKFKHSKQ